MNLVIFNSYLFKIIITFITILVLLVLIGYIFTRISPVFGGNFIDLKMEKSKNFINGKFKNLVETTVQTQILEELSDEEKFSLYGYFFPEKGKNPLELLPSVTFDKDNFENNSFSWLGHSTILMKLNNKTIITDPVFNNASPLSFSGHPFGVKNPTNISDLTKLDYVIISHDHYDHLDYKTIKELGNNVGMYLVPLGVDAHLIKWGIDAERIETYDWYNGNIFDGIEFIFAPSRHFSGRNFDNRNSTLWGSWIIKTEEKSVYFSGDGGYSDEFKKIGDNYGPFDITFLENGAYNKAWSQIHMFPEESVQAGVDLNSKLLFPIHWGKFDLSTHIWTDSIDRFTTEAKNKNLSYTTPLIGEIFTTEKIINNEWWK